MKSYEVIIRYKTRVPSPAKKTDFVLEDANDITEIKAEDMQQCVAKANALIFAFSYVEPEIVSIKITE